MRASFIIAGKDLRSLLRDRMALFWVAVFPLGFALFFGSVMKAGLDAESAPLSVALVLDSQGPAAQALSQALSHSGLKLKRATSVPEVQTTLVARDSRGRRSGFEIMFPAMLIWGLLGCAATFAVSLVSERNSGTLLRLRAAPISLFAILGGKSLACATACVADLLLLSLLGASAFRVQIDEPLKYAAALAACTVCFSGLTMGLSVIGKTEQAVAGAGWATLIVLAMLGGAMVPISLMPTWLLTWSEVSPVKWGIVALEGATWRDLHWLELIKPLGLLVGCGVASFGVGVWVLLVRREV
jgi:ABC-type multidrug transport system permease subunit